MFSRLPFHKLWFKTTASLQLWWQRSARSFLSLKRGQPDPLNRQLNLRWNQLEYLLQETGLGLCRGGWLNWAAISTVTVLLFLFGIGLQSSWQIEGLLQRMGSQLEISVYLQPGVQAASLQPAVARFPQVARVEVISKEQAWQELLKEMGGAEIAGLTAGLEGNPLVEELQVTSRSTAVVPELAQQLNQIQGVGSVQYLDQALQSLNQLSRGVQQIGFVVVVLLSATAIAVISTTIRLIVLARQQEIEIMQLVGATASWIYLPFILQGVGFGLTGGTIAWVGLMFTEKSLLNLLGQQPDLLQLLGDNLQLQPLQSVLLLLLLLGLGSTIGCVGSLVAVRRSV